MSQWPASVRPWRAPYYPIHLGEPGCDHRWKWTKVDIGSSHNNTRGKVTRKVCTACGAWDIDLKLKASQDELARQP